MKKKLLLALCIAAIVCNMTACGSSTVSESTSETTTSSAAAEATSSESAETDYSDTTLVGKIVSEDDDTLTLLIGELSSDNSTPPQMPENGGSNQPSSDGNQPPENGSSNQSSSDGNQPPENSDSNQSSSDGNQPPELPSDGEQGNAPSAPSDGQTPPEMPSRNSFTASDETVTLTVGDDAKSAVSEFGTDDVVQIKTDSNGQITSIEKVDTGMGGGFGGQTGGPDGQNGGPSGAGGFGGSSTVTQGLAANTIDADGTYTGETYTSTGDDENALRVDGATVTLENVTVDKSAGATSNTENGDFYGVNAALLATNGANVTITGAAVTSSAQNGNGVFSYGEGTVVTISDSSITTTADNSGGIQTTGGGTTNAYNLTVNTSGNSSAAIRSDRGGGTVNVDGGTYTSNGYNSPAVYSTADITVKNAVLTANNSEALVIEGQNSITLENCEVSGNMSDTQGTSSDENVHNVMIYQSMSGDAEVGTSTFSMTGGTLTSNNGDMFYITNTHCVLSLSGVKIVNNESDGYLLLVTGNSASHGWGTAGSNGAQVEFTADGQTLEGDIAVDTISTLTMTLTGNSTFTGTVNIIENEDGGTAVDNNAVITIDEGSTWNLTGNCTVTSLVNNGTINFNGYTITLADGTVLNG